ncbi:MAG: hypothetical protein K0R29_383 [Pseudobdellovibrio sp.]|jgi:hypothetical protein|nr:hypothetical protein [Pseudobdellovibrio sp.]
MKKLNLLITLLALSSCTTTNTDTTNASREPAAIRADRNLKMRFQLANGNWDQGVRLAEYRTSDVDVTYKVHKVDPYNVIFKVYISNVGKKALRVDSSLFNITSLRTKKLVVAQSSLWADEKRPVAAMSLQPGESASSELKFPVNEPVGQWALKNKLTDHTFNFAVNEN